LSIAIGAVMVDAGDIVVGDRDGVVVVPRAGAAAAAGELKSVLAKEAKMEQGVKAGLVVPAWLEDARNAKGVTYLE
jgi:regulator of RNase E activity RraA